MSAKNIHSVSREELASILETSSSLAAVLRRLGVRVHTAYYALLRKKIAEEGLTWVPPSAKTKPIPRSPIPLENILVNGGPHRNYSRSNLKKRLVAAGLLELSCKACGLSTSWQGKPLTLHLDHINGVRSDNRIKNLQFLCPNCHSQTSTYCGRNVKRKKSKKRYFCSACRTRSRREKRAKVCSSCNKKAMRKVARPSQDRLQQEVRELGYSGTGRKYGVSDNAIRKWLKLTSKS